MFLLILACWLLAETVYLKSSGYGLGFLFALACLARSISKPVLISFLTLLLLLLTCWLFAQAVFLRSIPYGLGFLFALFLLVRLVTRYAVVFSILFLLCFWLAIKSPPVQSWLVSKSAALLSRELHTRIRVGHVDLSFFDRLTIRQTLVEDQNKDTLLYAGELTIRISDWFFAKDSITLHYIGISDAQIRLQRSDSVWNYQFLADLFSAPSKTKSKSEIALDLKRIELDNIRLVKKDGWRGEDMDLKLGSMSLQADEINLSKKIAHLRSISFDRPVFSITNYEGRRRITPVDTAEIRNDKKRLRWNPGDWDITVADASIRDGSFRDDKLNGLAPSDYFDSRHIYFSSIDWDFANLRLRQDTLSAGIKLSVRERSGLYVRRLSAGLKFYPEAMEFNKLDLETGKSHLYRYFAMRYKSFDDMSDFNDKIEMDGDFTDAHIDSDDIAYFAPELKNWKKKVRISGRIWGTVSNLNGKNLFITAGKNTLLNGDITMKGLPDIDKTFISFKSNDFKTSYDDMLALVPHLKTIVQPRLDLLSYLRFKGTFKGYLKDFEANGTIETRLGSLVTDVNMQFPQNRPTIYTGKLNTADFELGKFLDNPDIGQISFSGKINGSGLGPNTLNAELDGTVQNLEFHDYTYQDIVVKGSLAKKRFNGRLVSADPNLQAVLDGLIDFSSGLPRFDFDAQVDRVDFKKLNFLRDQLEFNGKLQFNFTGNDIDNILGEARIYEAAIFKNGVRISFDSLTLQSSVAENNNKTITILSNEFDAALVGAFSIRDLPAAFQTFLNKYYPSYVMPAKSKLAPEDFSFVITTKKVDDYLELFEKKLKGFNNSSINGRLDTRENLLELNADIPQFAYGKTTFNNVTLKGSGNLDSLSAETTIGDVLINDSLHFPGTHIRVHSASDLSDITVRTSANQTLNSANISAQVRTVPDGIRIKFKPSVFEVNSKPWTINKDGELILSKELVSANDLRIYSGDQQILIGTIPSKEGNWNDVHIELKKINIGDFTPYFVKSDRIEGLITGSTDITDPFGDRQTFNFKGQAEQFRLNNDSVGKLDIGGSYDKNTGLVNARISSENRNYNFDIKGVFSTLDSAKSSSQPIDMTIRLKDTKIDLLEKYLDGVFSNISGFVSGDLHIAGPGNRLKYMGKVQLRDGKLKVAYTQCIYKIPLANIDLEDGYIDFGTFEIQDMAGHTGELTRGRLYHRSFNDLGYDFAINTNKLLLLDTKLTDNNQFYGKLIGRCSFTLTGKQENMAMNIKGEPTDSSNIYIPSSTSRESAESDFIVWKVYGKAMQSQQTQKSSNLTVKLDITANNYANIYVVIDPLTNDVIRANGRGNLLIRVGTSEDMTIHGRYDIDRGSYNFSFQSLIHKPFTFSRNADNFIQWNGNPYDANINVEAVYEAENISFNDLGYGSLGLVPQNSQIKKYRVPIEVIAKISDKLMKPSIEFEIQLPSNSPLKNDQDALTLLQAIQKDPTELNKQVSFLVVFDQFGPMSNSTTNFSASTAVSGVFVNSISGVFSNVLSKWSSTLFQKIFNDPNIKVNFNSIFYNGSNQLLDADPSRLTYDRTNLNLTIGKSFLNERLTFIFGSALDFGLSPQQAQAAAFQFLPDITAEYKITPDGRFAFSLFYRDSYNYLSIANHTENSSGGSISYTRDFDRFDELFKKKKKKDKKKEKPREESNPVSTTTGSQ